MHGRLRTSMEPSSSFIPRICPSARSASAMRWCASGFGPPLRHGDLPFEDAARRHALGLSQRSRGRRALGRDAADAGRAARLRVPDARAPRRDVRRRRRRPTRRRRAARGRSSRPASGAGRLVLPCPRSSLSSLRIGGEPPSGRLGQLYLDTASYHPASLRAAIDTVGVERLVLGTDYPPAARSPKPTIDLVESLGLSDDDRDRILGGNARALLDRSGTPSRPERSNHGDEHDRHPDHRQRLIADLNEAAQTRASPHGRSGRPVGEAELPQ